MSVESVLSASEKLARQRQAAAIARSHAHLIQLKIVVVCGCAIASAFGFALYRAGAAGSSSGAPAAEKPGIYQGPSSRRLFRNSRMRSVIARPPKVGPGGPD